jgi:threonine dehydrogenase-like Zn-dependent dehydrogenase
VIRAARYHGRGDVRVEVIPEPHAGPDEVTVAVAYHGLCGTDLHEYLHGPHHIPVTPHPLTRARLPIILGHEFAGTIREVGSDVNDLVSGDREYLLDITSGAGAAIAYDAAGATGVDDTALRCVGVGGVMVSSRPVPVDPGALLRAEAEWTGSLGYTATDFEEVLALMGVNHYRTDGWVEHVDLDDVVTAGFEPMATGRSKKLLVDIGEAA